jgi:sugar-specific transcriptional regulator TrmB
MTYGKQWEFGFVTRRNNMDFKEQYQNYEQKLNQLKSQCTEAEKQAIVAETNLNNLRQQRETLIEECETFAGVSMDKVPEVLQQKKEELDAIMAKLATIDTTGPVTQEKLDAIKAIADEFSINPVE